MKLGSEILIEDEALRDRLQNEQREYTAVDSARFVAALPTRRGASAAAPVVNRARLERALAADVQHLSISVSASQKRCRAFARSPSREMND